MIYKLRPSVAVVEMKGIIEFFLSNIRKSIILKVSDNIENLLFKFDGNRTFEDICKEEKIYGDRREEFRQLIEFLNDNKIMLKVDEEYMETYKKYPRIYNLLEDYYSSKSEINEVFKKFQESKIMIIGLGAVGTWISHNLIMSGVENLILVDYDKIEKSNLHRQLGFIRKNIEDLKTRALRTKLLEMNKNLKVELINDKLDFKFFEKHKFEKIDLIINCADYPNVDITSEIIGEYCMKKNIPHLIGGGYNLHMTLIGQAVIPGESACVNCFKKNLEEINKIDTKNIKKLIKQERKIGSFTPLVTLTSSITSNEAIKILLGINKIVMKNNRCEFKLNTMNFENLILDRRKDCEWCGEKGKYYKI